MKTKQLLSIFSLVVLGSIIFLSLELPSSTTLVTPASQSAAISGAGSGLTAHYTFDDGTAADAAGGAKNGTLSGGPTQVAGKVDAGALSFDGVDDKVILPTGAGQIGSGNFSIALWANYTGPTSGNVYQAIASSRASGEQGLQMDILLVSSVHQLLISQ